LEISKLKKKHFLLSLEAKKKPFLVVVGNSSTLPIHYSNNGRFKRQQTKSAVKIMLWFLPHNLEARSFSLSCRYELQGMFKKIETILVFWQLNLCLTKADQPIVAWLLSKVGTVLL
jgi:hypothetical protein